MSVTARKSNPGFLTDDELVASFCVRTTEFESMVEALRECTGNANTHQIVIGPRGSGKTSLLLRIAAEIRRDENLSGRFFPVVYAEESYEVSTAGEFWLECLSRLADEAPRRKDRPNLRRSFEDLRQIRDDDTLRHRCLGVLQDFADMEGKRLVLIVENLNMLLRDIGDEDTGWQLRHTLQTEPWILLLASATSRFDEIDNPEKALYDLFRVLSLSPLDQDDCTTLWQVVCGQSRSTETIQALRILTGGNPRLLTIVARFGGNLSFRELMADLLNLVDDHTEYFKSHLDGLPAQERKVYLALIQLWKPVSAREVADLARLATSQCSAHLKRLTERGAVVVAGGTERRKLYYVAERLYNIYYLMRRARGRASLIEALIRFMEAFYSPSELMDFVIRTAREAMSLDGEARWMHRIAFDRLPTLEYPFSVALAQKSMLLDTMGRQEEGLALRNEAMQHLSESDEPRFVLAAVKALTRIGDSLADQNRFQEALAVWDEVVERIGTVDAPAVRDSDAVILAKKGDTFVRMNRPDDALAVWDEVVRRFGSSDTVAVQEAVTVSLFGRGNLLVDLNRPQDALDAMDNLLGRFGSTSVDSTSRSAVTSALLCKARALTDLNRLQEADAVYDEVLKRDSGGATVECVGPVAAALVAKGAVLVALDRPAAALTALEGAVRRCETSDHPRLQHGAKLRNSRLPWCIWGCDKVKRPSLPWTVCSNRSRSRRYLDVRATSSAHVPISCKTTRRHACKMWMRRCRFSRTLVRYLTRHSIACVG